MSLEPYVMKYEAPDTDLALAHFDDPNIDRDEAIAGILEDDSPYPEVRSAVANTDDPDIPVSTIRAWVLGLIFTIIISGLNQFLYVRFPTVTVTGIVSLLLILPLGRLWALTVPNINLFGAPLNPGRFSIKEHVLASIMASSSLSAGSTFATDVFVVQRILYDQTYNFGYQWMLVISTQLIGFSIGGICRRFLVNPPSMIWPGNLVVCALFNTLHAQTYAGMGHRGGISREKFFYCLFLASAIWYVVPGYLFQALSYFSWVCWIAPDNIPVNELFGYTHGLGMSLITFDWSLITFSANSPLVSPWWAEANILVGFVIFFWILTPVFHYLNVWSGMYMPIASRGPYDNSGLEYNVSRILNKDATFNQQEYEKYSPLFVSTTFAVAYGLSFASITAIVVHTLLYFRKQIWTQSRRSVGEQPDIHARLMSRYPQVPEWWYAIILLTMFTFGIVIIERLPTKLPIPWFILALVIGFTFVIPIGMIQAITSQQVGGINIITELIIGYGLPGRPFAVLLFKTWGSDAVFQALSLTSDFKLGHYMKIPPRPMFWSQVVATIVAGTVQLGVQSWMFSNISDICDPHQNDGFSCLQTQVFGTASVIWGLIGPARQFSRGQIYYGLSFFFLVGALCPLFAYLVSRKFPNSWIRYVVFPILFGFSPTVNYAPWGIVGFIFQYVIRRRHFSWWVKYNYVLSAALDSGVAISSVLVFFILQYPKDGTIGQNNIQTWWGNVVFTKTADYSGKPLLSVAEGSHFGPDVW